ncbi:transporter substrate-binding domain-containing protein [Mesorhizobium sp. 1B3]|uniref:transporter substrate-binding domain-containing protein n=1 Tax=Mesorhizobium sp. 1B3 TaxID=3243599 RepID=UPI003D9814AC
MGGAPIRILALLVGLLAVIAGAAAAPAQTQPPSTTVSEELAIGIKAAPPFAFKLEDGSWSGLSVDLWKRIAERLGLGYRFEEVPNVQDQIAGIASGRFDAATAAISVTADREKAIDFTQPFYAAGLGIAVPLNREPSWRPILHALTSFGFLQAILALICISLVVGMLIWLFERRHNEDFGGGAAKGLFNSLWWSTIAATQASTGELSPRTVPGRALAVLWMVGSIIAIAVFTAGVTSVLTVKQMEGLVQSESDLASVKVGALANSSTDAYLAGTHIRHSGYPSVQAGLDALRSGQIDAFVYDRPLLSWLIGKDYSSSLRVLDVSFERQNYAIALPKGSPLREPLDLALLQILESDWWDQATFQYLNEK